MAEFARTSIKRLKVEGYRSLRSLDLQDLPNLIVLYGPNGAGKSNILKAAQLLLRALSLAGPIPGSSADAKRLTLAEANAHLDLRPDDFAHGVLPEIRISLEISLGEKARQILAAPADFPLDRLFLSAVFQDTGDKSIRHWFERADIDDRIGMIPNREMGHSAQILINQATQQQPALAGEQSGLRVALPSLQSQLFEAGTIEQQSLLTRAIKQVRSRDSQIQQALIDLGGTIDREQPRVDQEPLIASRVLGALIPNLMQTSGAYRAPHSSEDPTDALYAAFLSENPREREAARSLGRRLGEAGLFGQPSAPIDLIPIEAKSFSEKQIRFTHPTHGSLSLRNLGSGEQQLVLLLGQRVITPFPIAILEEPEAHLHKTLMEPLARALKASVDGATREPDVDQLWIATHHHYFALADEFFDVRLDDKGSTVVERKSRDAVVAHFYEPSPYWDTLELLVKNGMSPDTVVYRDSEGKPATAAEVLASVRGDRELAKKFVEAATKAFVLSLSEETPET